jgi:hypothetical protein
MSSAFAADTNRRLVASISKRLRVRAAGRTSLFPTVGRFIFISQNFFSNFGAENTSIKAPLLVPRFLFSRVTAPRRLSAQICVSISRLETRINNFRRPACRNNGTDALSLSPRFYLADVDFASATGDTFQYTHAGPSAPRLMAFFINGCSRVS